MRNNKWNESSDPHELLTALRTLNYPNADLCRLARRVIVRKRGEEPTIDRPDEIPQYRASPTHEFDYAEAWYQTHYQGSTVWLDTWNRDVREHWHLPNGLLNSACVDPLKSFEVLHTYRGERCKDDPEGCDLIRENVGNPFDLPIVRADWLTADVLALVDRMHESRDVSALPILADALQDAGCASDDILNHLRQRNKPHDECCWVLNLLNSPCARFVDDVLSRSRKARLLRWDMTDPLTGIGNRRAFDVVLTEGVNRAVNVTSPLSVLDLDFDHFKRLNRDFSFPIGDRVLAEVARLLRDTLDNRGFLARTTGDGFTVVLPDTDPATALETGERLRRAVAEWRGSDPPIMLTVSIGVSTLDPAAPDAGRLLGDADAARRRAKDAGRNRVCEPRGRLGRDGRAVPD